MKIISIFSVMALCVLTIFSACKNEGDAARDAAVENVGSRPDAGTPIAPPSTASPTTPEPAQNAAGVWHYTCSKGCAGGAGTATACTNCGNTLAHNAAYHNTANQAATTPKGNANLTPVIPPAPEPAQNSAGVWHYTCSSGCAGGAGTATACSKCGTTLAHNAAYHK